MPLERKEKLDQVISKIHKRWGTQAIGRSSKQLDGKIPCIPSGFPELDIALGIGGIPRGRISEFIAAPTSGMTTLALNIVAQVQMIGGTAVYIDLDRTFDPAYARGCGVFLDQVTLVHPHTAAQALNMLPDFIHNGGFDILICDMPARVQQDEQIGRTLTSTLGRLLAPLNKSSATLLFITTLPAANGRRGKENVTYPRHGTLPHFTTLRLLIQSERWLYRQRDVVGYEIRITVIKNKLSAPGNPARIALYLTDPLASLDQ